MRRISLVLVTCLTLFVSAAPVVAAPPDNPAGLQRVIVQLRAGFPSPRSLVAQSVAGSVRTAHERNRREWGASGL